MQYLRGNFSVAMSLSDQGRENFDRIFGKKDAGCVKPNPGAKIIAEPAEHSDAKIMKCPGCGGEKFTASVAQMDGSFTMLHLRCECGDGLWLEEQVPPGSKIGTEFGITWGQYLVDLEHRLILARRRAEEAG